MHPVDASLQKKRFFRTYSEIMLLSPRTLIQCFGGEEVVTTWHVPKLITQDLLVRARR